MSKPNLTDVNQLFMHTFTDAVARRYEWEHDMEDCSELSASDYFDQLVKDRDLIPVKALKNGRFKEIQ